MTKQKQDLRVRRTRKMLREAFIKLVISEGFDALNVQMLADEAMINRATFYRHFEDKFDLAQKIYLDLAAEYVTSLHAEPLSHPDEATRLLFEHVGHYADFYLRMLETMPQFQGWVRQNIEDELKTLFMGMGIQEEGLEVPLPLSLRYLANAQLGLVQWWLEDGMRIPTAEMAVYLRMLHANGGIQALNFG